MPLVGPVVVVTIEPGAALTRIVPEVAVAEKLPRVRRLPRDESPTGTTEMMPPPVPMVRLPKACETARPVLPVSWKTPPARVGAGPEFGVPIRYGCEAVSVWPAAVAVALPLIVKVVAPVIAVTYVLAGIFGPVIKRPTARPVVLATVTFAEAFVVEAPVRLAGAATFAKSRAKVPPLIVSAPVERLSLAELSVKTPAPSLAKARFPMVVALKTPEKLVLVSSRPIVSVAAPALFVTVPAPAMDPTVWPKAAMSRMAPVPMMTALRCGMTLASPA